MIIVIIGAAGEMAKIIELDLKESSPAGEIILADLDLEAVSRRCRELKDPRFKPARCDARDTAALTELLKRADICINAAQYYVNLNVMAACLSTGTSYIDLGGLFHMTLKQKQLHQDFVNAGIPALLGMGSTPGSIGVLARYAADRLDIIHSADAICAWKEFAEPRPDTPFVPPYAIRTILEEITEEPWAFIDGELKPTPPCSGEELVKFPEPLGAMSCFRVLHSEPATWPDTWKDKGIKNCSFKLGMPPELLAQVKFLAKLGFHSKQPLVINDSSSIAPVDYLSNLIKKQIDEASPEAFDYPYDIFEILRARVTGNKGNQPVTCTVDLQVGLHSRWKVFADTGVPPSIASRYMAEGKIPAGVWAPEQVIEPEPYFHQLAKREMKVKVYIEYQPG